MHKYKVHVVKRADTGLLAGLYGFDETKPEHIIESIELKPYIHIFSTCRVAHGCDVVYSR